MSAAGRMICRNLVDFGFLFEPGESAGDNDGISVTKSVFMPARCLKNYLSEFPDRLAAGVETKLSPRVTLRQIFKILSIEIFLNE